MLTNAVIACHCYTYNCLITGFRAPLIAEEELPAITDGNIDSEIRKLIGEAQNVIAQSISTESDEVKRILQSPATSATASSLWKKARCPDLKRVLKFRGESVEGLKRELFQRAYPMHAKVLPPPRPKRKTAAQKKEEKDWENACKRNAKAVKKEFIVWVEALKNEVRIVSAVTHHAYTHPTT